MLPSKTAALDKILVRLLALHPFSTAKDLHAKINRDYRTCTLAGVYHELGKLLEQQVVVKQGMRFSLSLLWALEMLDFADRIYDNYIASISSLDLFPNEGESKEWPFSDIRKMDAFYVQLTLALIQHVKEEYYFEWSPHPWYNLIKPDFERRLKNALDDSKKQIYCVIGGQTPLDKPWMETRSSPSIHCSNAPGPFQDKRREHFTMLGPYLLTAKIDGEGAQWIDDFFDKHRSLTESSVRALLGFLDTRRKLSVRIENKPNKAGRIRRKFCEYFNIHERKRR